MKRIISLLVAVVMMVTVYSPIFAVHEADIVNYDNAYEIAYLELTGLNAEEKAAVLKA